MLVGWQLRPHTPVDAIAGAWNVWDRCRWSGGRGAWIRGRRFGAIRTVGTMDSGEDKFGSLHLIEMSEKKASPGGGAAVASHDG